MKVAIVIGHSREHQGATAVDGVQEWAWQEPLAAGLCIELRAHGINAAVFERQPLAYFQAMHTLCEAINGWGADLVVSLHFNAFDGPITALHGTMALHWPGSRAGKEWARVLSSACARAQGTRDRGPRAQSRSWSGKPLHLLKLTRAPAVILESHYGDHADDHQRATTSRDRGTTARHLAMAIEGARR